MAQNRDHVAAGMGSVDLEAETSSDEAPRLDTGEWQLEDQVGFLLRRAQQRHLTIFDELIGDLTPTQFSAMAILAQHGLLSQNDLGRRTAMDTATIKGVVDRLRDRQLVETWKDTRDKRRIAIRLTAEGLALIDGHIRASATISAETLAPLSPSEARQLIRLLRKIA